MDTRANLFINADAFICVGERTGGDWTKVGDFNKG